MNTNEIIDAIGMIKSEYVLDAHEKHHKIRISRFVKPALAIAAAACIVVPLPTATAMGYDKAYNILYSVSPKIAQTFKPVEKSCEDNGITMEVVSANVEDSKASFLISMQGDKIDGTIDLFDSYYINCPFDNYGGVTFSEFDENTKTAYFLVNIGTMNGEKIKKDKITFGVRNILLNKRTYSGVISDIDLTNVPLNLPSTCNVNYRGASGYELDAFQKDYKEYTVLKEKNNLSNPLDSVTITGIGYIDNALHVQVHYDDILHTDNHGFISLVDENGSEYDDKYTTVVSFWDTDNNGKNSGSYDETIIDIPYNDLGKYNLYGEFITSDGYTSGDWEITFKAE